MIGIEGKEEKNIAGLFFISFSMGIVVFIKLVDDVEFTPNEF